MASLLPHGQVSGLRWHGLLPAEAASFVGRDAELRAVARLLRAARLVTVVGTAGVGKTRLALRAAALLAHQFPDGICLVELSGVDDPARLSGAVGAALGLAAAADGTADVLSCLRSRQLLLILDTCEHLVDACASFAESVLRAVPGVSLLATSRQPLDAPGEHALPLAPLPVEPDAVRLFEERAAAVIPGFAIAADNRSDVARLCRRLDGIPLAIELAAVRLRALPLPELADLVATGLDLLAASRRGTTPRHQTLRAAVEWSYALCTPAERALWARLSVFGESFDLAAAEAVCADAELPREEVIHTLVGLVDKSVVLRTRGNQAGIRGGDGLGRGTELGEAGTRYRLLNTLREFGAERLAASGGRDRYLGRLTGHYLGLARAQLVLAAPAAPAVVRHVTASPEQPSDNGRAASGAPDDLAGADGKPPAAIRSVTLLTKRERQIADLVGSGLSNREIAARLFISKRTVDAHVDHIFGKLEISSRVQLTVLLQNQILA